MALIPSSCPWPGGWEWPWAPPSYFHIQSAPVPYWCSRFLIFGISPTSSHPSSRAPKSHLEEPSHNWPLWPQSWPWEGLLQKHIWPRCLPALTPSEGQLRCSRNRVETANTPTSLCLLWPLQSILHPSPFTSLSCCPHTRLHGLFLIPRGARGLGPFGSSCVYFTHRSSCSPSSRSRRAARPGSPLCSQPPPSPRPHRRPPRSPFHRRCCHCFPDRVLCVLR